MKKSNQIWLIAGITLIILCVALIILIKTQQLNLVNQAPFFESNWHKLNLNPQEALKYS